MNTQFKIQELIAKDDSKEAIALLREKIEDKRYENTIILLESRVSRLDQDARKNVIKKEEYEIEKNKINNAILEINADISKIKSIKNKKRKLKLWLWISLPILLISSLLLLDFYYKKNIIAIGGGSVYAYLLCYFPELFEGYQLTEPKVVPFETPTLTGIEAFSYTYQHGEPEDNDFKHLPPVLGMASMELNDTLFNKVKDIEKNNKIYAIQIGLDSLFVSIGYGTSANSDVFKTQQFGVFAQNGMELNPRITIEQLSIILADKGIVKFVNVPNSGSFNSWNNYFIKSGLPPIDTNFVTYANRNNNQSLEAIRQSDSPWILLDSRKYNISSQLKMQYKSIEVVKNNDPLTRPLYIYGRADVKVVSSRGKSVYPIRDNDGTVCKFWNRLINGLDHKHLLVKNYIKSLKNEFLVTTPDREECKCGIVAQGTDYEKGIINSDRLIMKKYK